MGPKPITPVEQAISGWVRAMLLFQPDMPMLAKLSADMSAQTARQVSQASDRLAVAAEFLSEAARLRLEELSRGLNDD